MCLQSDQRLQQHVDGEDVAIPALMFSKSFRSCERQILNDSDLIQESEGSQVICCFIMPPSSIIRNPFLTITCNVSSYPHRHTFFIPLHSLLLRSPVQAFEVRQQEQAPNGNQSSIRWPESLEKLQRLITKSDAITVNLYNHVYFGRK